ncbi:hypothetical protein [Gemmobacter serpentinus]|uniref:hypothetical protein n=1 Tax=Gemmobacter serpentinus TaxID=2652247 RepID=UPI00124F4F2C|nr:hypothetical protein [Gemmobacter serpentinus]
MMMSSYALVAGVIGLVQAVSYIALLFVLFYKSGLRGGLMVVCVLPIVALLGNMVTPMMLAGGEDSYLTFLVVNTVLGALCYMGPLLVLAIAKWPVIAVSRPEDLFT